MKRAAISLGAAIGTAVAMLAPAAARACPVCASGEPQGSTSWVLLAAMIGIPYAVGAVAFRAIRSVDRLDRGEPK